MEFNENTCKVCFKGLETRPINPLCYSCIGFYKAHKKNVNLKCLAKQDCDIYHAIQGCLRCRMNKTKKALQGN